MRLTSAVRIGLVIVLSVTIAWIGTVALFYLSGAGGTRNTRPLPGQIAALVALLEQTPSAQRSLVLRAVTSQTLTARLEPGLHIGVTPRLQRVPRLTARAVDQYLVAVGGRPNSVTVSREHRGQGGLGLSFATPVDLELRVGLATGETLVVDALSYPVTNLFGLPVGFVAGLTGAVIGLIALLALQREAAFNRLQVRLSHLVRGRIALLGGISHDVRTFLTRLRLRVDRIPDEEERERAVADIADMLRLLDDALLASRAGAGELAEELVDFAQVVRAEMEDRGAAGKHMDLRVGATLAGSAPGVSPVPGVGPGPAAQHSSVGTAFNATAFTPTAFNPTVLGDRLALRRVVANLVDNAVTYGKAAHLYIDADSDYATLIVDDEGPGIPVDQREAILEPFVRLEDSRNRRTGGAGLGLAIARSLVEAHSGTISIADAPSGGRARDSQIAAVRAALGPRLHGHFRSTLSTSNTSQAPAPVSLRVSDVCTHAPSSRAASTKIPVSRITSPTRAPRQLLLNAFISRNDMSVCTVRDDRVDRDGSVGMRPPREKSRALGNIHRIENPVLRHRPPSQRQILGYQGGESIDPIAFIAQNPGRDVVVRAGSQCPTAMRDGGSRCYVRLQGVVFRYLPIGRVHAPVCPQVTAIPQAGSEQSEEKRGPDINRWHTLKYEPRIRPGPSTGPHFGAGQARRAGALGPNTGRLPQPQPVRGAKARRVARHGIRS